MTNTSNFTNIQIHIIIFNATLPHKLKILPFAQNLFRDLSNRSRTELEKQNLTSYWPSDECDTTDEELQKDPPEASVDNNSVYKSFTYVSFENL